MYRIRRAAELAGVSPELLRAWERRYGLVAPVRTDAGYRVYSDEDVQVLRGAKRLVDAGQSIAEVAQLPREQLMAPGPMSESLMQPAPVFSDTPAPRFDLSPLLREAIAAIGSFDHDRLEATLFRVVTLGSLPPEDVCESFLLPLLAAIGDEWEASRLSIAAEHFGSSIIRSKILRLIEHQRPKAPANAVVCACPAGEEHEGALLAFAVSASRSGMRVVYLGADTPAQDIVRTAERTSAKLVALSITKRLSSGDVQTLVAELEPWRLALAGRQIIVGGRGAQASRLLLEEHGLHVAENSTVALAAMGLGAVS